MKNDNYQHIRQARETNIHRSVRPTDMLVIPEVVERNNERLASQPRRKRRINYEKKIIKDEFIFTV